MVRVSLNVWYIKLYLQHPVTARTSVGEIKTWNNIHTKFFRHCKCMNETELSKDLLNLKDHSFYNSLSWEIHKNPSPYRCGSKRCDLCFSEKVSINCADKDTLLNKRTELISKCHHRNKFLLGKIKKKLSWENF